MPLLVSCLSEPHLCLREASWCEVKPNGVNLDPLQKFHDVVLRARLGELGNLDVTLF